jgi:hypothetical protein
VGEAYVNPGTNSGVMLSSLVRSERPTYTSMAQIPVAPFLADIAKTLDKVREISCYVPFVSQSMRESNGYSTHLTTK